MHELADSTSWINLWVLTPALIFTARIFDVTIGTIRIVSVSRGRRYLAPFLGFFEVLIWLFAIRQIFQHVDHIAAFIAYAAGFAAGNWVGLIIEEKMALGLLAVRVITAEDATGLAARLRGANFGVTTVSAKGQSGDVQLVFMIIERREYDRVIAMIREVHPTAFISVEDVRTARQGIFPRGPLEQRFPAFQRKSK